MLTYPEPEAMPDRTPPGAMTGLRGKATWCEVVDEAQEWFDYWMRLWADEILMQGEVSR